MTLKELLKIQNNAKSNTAKSDNSTNVNKPATTASSKKSTSLKELLKVSNANGFSSEESFNSYTEYIEGIANLLRETPDRVVVGKEPEKVVPEFPKIPTSPEEGSPADMLVGAEPSAPLPVVPGQEKKYVLQEIYDAAVEYNKLYDEAKAKNEAEQKEVNDKNATLQFLSKIDAEWNGNASNQEIADKVMTDILKQKTQGHSWSKSKPAYYSLEDVKKTAAQIKQSPQQAKTLLSIGGITQELYDLAIRYNGLLNRKKGWLSAADIEAIELAYGFDNVYGDKIGKGADVLTVGEGLKKYATTENLMSNEYHEMVKATRENRVYELPEGQNKQNPPTVAEWFEDKFGQLNAPKYEGPNGEQYFNRYTYAKSVDADKMKQLVTNVYDKLNNDAFAIDKVRDFANTKLNDVQAKNHSLNLEIHNIVNGNEKVSVRDDNYKYSKLTDDEKLIYNYLAMNQTKGEGKKMAGEFLKLLDADLEQRAAVDLQADMNGFEKTLYIAGQGIGNTIENVAKAPAILMGGGRNTFEQNLIFDQDKGDYLASAIIENEDDMFVKFFYQSVQTISQQVPALAVGLATGGVGYSAVLSAGVISESAAEAIRNNKTLIEGVSYGVVQATIELALERLTGGIGGKFLGKGSSSKVIKAMGWIDNIINAKIPRAIIKGAIKRLEEGAGEFVQEFIQGITDPAIRNIIYKENNTYDTDTLLSALYQGLLGAVSGFALGGGVNQAQAQAKYEAMGEALSTKEVLDLAEKIGNTDSAIYQEVKKLAYGGKDFAKQNQKLLVQGKEITTDERTSFTEVSNELKGRLSEETTAKMYQDSMFTVETLKYIATEGSVNSIAETMFDGNQEAATKFKEKYTDETFLNNLDFGAIDKGNISNTFNEYLDSPNTALGFESIGANESVNNILKLAEQNGITDTETYQEVKRLKNNRKSVSKELKGKLIAEIKAKQNGRNQTASQVVNEEARAKMVAAANTVDGTTPPPTAGKVLKMNPISAKAKEYVKGIAQQLGTNLEFVNMAEELSKRDPKLEGLVVYPEGFYDPKTKTLYVGNEVQHPVEFVFKHELTHHGEVSSLYDDFAKAVRGTKAFAKWLDTQATYTAKDKANKEIELHDILNERYKNVGGLSEPKAQREVIANFVGDMLFKGDVEALSRLVEETTPESKNAIIRYIADFFKWLKAKFTGNPYISREIRELEAMYKDLIADANVSEYTGTDEDIVYDEAMSVSESNEDSKGRTLTKAQQRYFAKSKARDKYGRLLVLYHGSAKGGFMIFDPKASDDKISLFLTDSIHTAESYSGSREAIDTKKKYPKLFRALEGDRKAAGTKQGLYALYANLENPLIIDAKGKNWNQLVADPNAKVEDVNVKMSGYYNDLSMTITIGGQTYTDSFNNIDDAIDFVNRRLNKAEASRIKGVLINAESNGGFINYNKEFAWDNAKGQRIPYQNTRDIAQIAYEQGYDGVIFKNITDYSSEFGRPEYMPTGTVVVAFSPEQIKAVDNANPTKDTDIRYSMPGEAVESVSNNGQKTATKTTKNIDGSPKKSYSYYNEFATNVMIWEKSASTKPGDAKIFNFKNSVFVLMEATENGSIEVARGKYKEVKAEYERAYAKSTSEIHGNFESYGIEKGRDIWDLQHDENRGDALGDNAKTESQELQTDTSGNNEYLRTGDKGKQNLSMSMPATDRAYLNAVENGDMETAQRMVAEAAKANGYNSPMLYHGTQSFGFTKIETVGVEESMLWSPFFATNKIDTAQTYSGATDIRNISEKYEFDSTEDLLISFVSKVNQTAGIYNFMDYATSDFDEVLDRVEQGYADAKTEEMFNEVTDEIAYSLYENASHYEENLDQDDFFDSEEMLDFYKAVRELWEGFKSVATKGDVNSGNYQFYANTEGFLEVDAKGKNWNRLPDPRETEGKKGLTEEFGFGMFNTRDYAAYAMENGYKGVKIANLFDDGGRSKKSVSESADVYIFFNPQEQVKSADPVTYDDNGNVIPLSERFNSSNSDIRFSVPEGQSESNAAKETETDQKSPISKRSLYQKVQSGEMSFEEFTKALEQLGEEKRKQYGTIPDGEMVTETDRPVNAPKKVAPNKNLRRHVRTILEGNKSNEVSAAIKAEVLAQNKGMVYEPDSNEKQAERARKDIANQGYNTAKKNWLSDVDSINAQKIANGEALLRMADEQNNVEDAVELTAELAVMMTTAGQALQAAKLFKRMGSIGRLIYMQRFVNKINRDLSKRYKNAPPIVINEDLAGKLLETKTEAEAELVIEALKADIGKQMPANFLDKWNAWRYVSMLFNPTTHIRNFVGNGIFTPVLAIKEYLSAAMQSTVGGVKKDFNKTTTFKAKKRDIEFAKKDFEKKKEWLASSGKYDDFVDISEYRTIFTSKVGKPAEYIRKKNSELLEKEDVIFLKLHYVRNLARYLTANKFDPNTASRSQLDKAREYAAKRAWEYTFRDASKIANELSRLARDHKWLDVGINGIMPFKKTPINIFKRGVEYSPIGFLTTIGKAIRDLRAGEFTAAEFIDGLASNLTGTGLFLLGLFLSNLGVIKGGFDDEDKWFNKLLGEQEYAIQIGDFSYTINWSAPSAVPLFMGVAFNEMEMDENSNIIDSVINALPAGLEPFIELTMLQGVNDVLDTLSYVDEKEQIPAAIGTVLTSYFSQGLPTIGGKIANLIDDTRRTKYIDKTGEKSTALQAMYDIIAKKVPFLSMDRAKYVDAWGREEYTGDVIERFFQQFVSPGYASTVDSDAISEELRRLKDKTGESSVYPDSPNRYVMVGSTKRHLTKEEYYNYAVTAGQTKMDLVNEVMNSKYYDKLTDESKAEVIKRIYGYSEKLAKASQLDFSLEELREMYGKNADKVLTDERWNKFTYEQKQYLLYEIVMGDDKKAYQYAQSGGSVADYYILRRLKSQD